MSQPTSDKQNGAREKERIQHERARWWELRESYARCLRIAHEQWDAELERATAEQEALVTRMRDRTSEGTRATGAKFERDTGIEVAPLTPHARLVFLEKVVAGLLIYAERQHLPVTPEGKRATETPDEAGDKTAAALDVEADELAQAGETVGPDETAPGARRRRVVSRTP